MYGLARLSDELAEAVVSRSANVFTEYRALNSTHPYYTLQNLRQCKEQIGQHSVMRDLNGQAAYQVPRINSPTTHYIKTSLIKSQLPPLLKQRAPSSPSHQRLSVPIQPSSECLSNCLSGHSAANWTKMGQELSVVLMHHCRPPPVSLLPSARAWECTLGFISCFLNTDSHRH